jgi:hypothetical protein
VKKVSNVLANFMRFLAERVIYTSHIMKAAYDRLILTHGSSNLFDEVRTIYPRTSTVPLRTSPGDDNERNGSIRDNVAISLHFSTEATQATSNQNMSEEYN